MSQYGGPEYGNPEYGNPAQQPYGSPPPAYGTPPAPPYVTPQPPPYGAQQPSYGYTPPPVPYGSPWMPVHSPESSSVRSQAITSMILNIVSVLFCCPPLGLAGAITSGIAISRADTDVAAAKRLVGWGWGLLAASVVLAIVAFILVISLGLLGESSSSYDTSY